jgi:GNAT superfamily N-acetyltransferase
MDGASSRALSRAEQGKWNIRIRSARRGDGPTFLALVDALADYESLARPDAGARRRLVRDALGPRPRFELLLAEVDTPPRSARQDRRRTSAAGPPVAGYAAVFETYSTFLARPTLYLEDLFVLPQYRRRGVGHALFMHCVRTAQRRGCGRLEWQVLHWNQPAIDFYRRCGGKHLDQWQPFRMTQTEIHQVLRPQRAARPHA